MKKTNHGLDVLAGLLLLCAFAAGLFFALASGARIYKDISRVLEEQYAARTALGYVTTKLHQSDAAGAVSLGALDGTPALLIRETQDGAAYVTYVYYSDGYIRELFCPAEAQLTPADGLPVVAAERLDFSMAGNLVRIDCVTASGGETAYVSLVSGGAA